MAPPPFVSRDVFRLLVRLEAQKTHEVDTEALERRFRVPSGYATDETLEQRARKAQHITPGPGAYEPPPVACWGSPAAASESHASAVFASRASRDPFQLEPLERRVRSSPPDDGLRDGPPGKPLPAPPLGSFTRADRGISPSPVSRSSPTRAPRDPPTAAQRHQSGVSFGRAPRATHVPVVPACALGPAQYAVKRLWDGGEPVAPTAAVFSASAAKRELVWSPARALPSNAVAEAWDASPHYAKHRRRVERAQRRTATRLHTAPVLLSLQASASAPSLGSRRRGALKPDADALDPFEWLRRQPQGELRANSLASRHGLSELVRPLTAHAAAIAAAADASGGDAHEPPTAVDPPPPHPQHQQPQDDDEPMGDRVVEDQDPRWTARAGDARISVSCRLPGGLVVSLRLYSARRVRHLKAALVRRQTRFQNEDQFDLFLANGKPLAQPDEPLSTAGLTDRALVQVVPRARA